MKMEMTRSNGYVDGFCGIEARFPDCLAYMLGYRAGWHELLKEAPDESMLPGGTNDQTGITS